MNYWLLKSEPSTWSWSEQCKVSSEIWDGVRNYQARHNLKLMKKNDQYFFYHSVNEKQIMGIVEVVKEHFIDPTDKTKKFYAIKVRKKKSLINTVKLEQIKQNDKLAHLALVKQSRLSVMPIDKKSWFIICKLGGL